MRRTPRLRRFIPTLLAATIAVTAALPGTAGATGGFGDVEADAYYADAVGWMVGEEITTGIERGCFGPLLNVTRGQVAAFLHRLDESQGNGPVAVEHPFADVTAAYQQAPVGWLYAEGLTTGIGPASFAPDLPISRGDFAVLLWRYAGSPTAANPSPFVDIDRGYQRMAVAWMAEQAITTGTSPTTFDPDGFVNRAQAAAFLFRFVAPAEVQSAADTETCTRELRLALEIAGLTTAEAMCAAPWLTDFDVAYLLDVVNDRDTASFELIIAAATIGSECLSLDRVADLSRLFL